MIKPYFAKKNPNKILTFGNHTPNNQFLIWLSKKKYSYSYEHYLSELFLNHKTGWMLLKYNSDYPDSLYLDLIVIDDPCRGHGTKHMEVLKEFSEETKTPITLICMPMRNSDPDRLRKFYRRLGFKKKGKFYIYEVLEENKKRH